MRRSFVTLILLSLSWCFALSCSHYATIYNQFGSLLAHLESQLLPHCSSVIDGKTLTLSNGNATSQFLLDTTAIYSENYQYLVRAASLNNRAGGSYSVTDEHGKRRRVSHPMWGVVFNYRDAANYCRIEASWHNTHLFDDLNDSRFMIICTYECINQVEKLLRCDTITDGVDMHSELNTFAVNVNGNQVAVMAGKKSLSLVSSMSLTSHPRPVQTGLYVGAGAKVAVERTVLTHEDSPKQSPVIISSWTPESLEQHFAVSDDPIEGFWQYQDRDMEDKWLRLGGRYTLALVASQDGYDIIYVNGAQVNASQWQTGMVKGHISKTIFDGHYDLSWIDAMLDVISQDAYATLENGVLITLHFPIYKSQFRLSKILNP